MKHYLSEEEGSVSVLNTTEDVMKVLIKKQWIFLSVIFSYCIFVLSQGAA